MKAFTYYTLCLLTVFFGLNDFIFAQVPQVYVLNIKEEIDAKVSRYMTLGLEKAQSQKARCVIIEMDTYGGTLNDADAIRKKILDCRLPVYVFINRNAASAGALISIACDSIYMSAGSNIGAATVVNQEGVPAPDKYQSYMRALMRSTAQANKRDPAIAEKMVGSFSQKDSSIITKVLSFSTEEAIKNHYCEAVVTSIEEVLARNKLSGYSLITYELSILDRTVAFFLNPYLKSILILLIIAGIYFELQTPGIGFALLTAIIASLLYFVPSYLTGLAENWEILLFLGGIVLLVLEIFVIPGFGVAGIAGIVCTFAGLLLVMLNNDFLDFTLVRTGSLYEALLVTLVAFIGAIIFMFMAGPKFLQSRFFKNVALQESFSSEAGYTSNFNNINLIGQKGIAHTVLRPSGKIFINEKLYDAYTYGEFIEKETPVEVVELIGTSLRVRALQ